MNKNKIFIDKAKLKHGDKYDYTLVCYINNRTKVDIICPEHGIFKQTPSDHLKGCGCPLCYAEKRKQVKTKLEDFIVKAKEIHNNKYNYSNVAFSGMTKPVTIICPKHGPFSMRPSNHINGQGCPMCANEKKGEYRKINIENFVERATEKHNGKYDYSKVEYINNHTKVCIICPEHGEFWQKPNDHLRGIGCQQCGNKYNLTEKIVLEALQIRYKNVIYQYTPLFLHGKTSAQSIDFFLPEYNIGIEYHGRQHFTPVTKFGGECGFNKTKERDLRKYQKCEENNVTLYYLTLENCDTSNYFANVYDDLNDLYKEIEKAALK